MPAPHARRRCVGRFRAPCAAASSHGRPRLAADNRYPTEYRHPVPAADLRRSSVDRRCQKTRNRPTGRSVQQQRSAQNHQHPLRIGSKQFAPHPARSAARVQRYIARSDASVQNLTDKLTASRVDVLAAGGTHRHIVPAFMQDVLKTADRSCSAAHIRNEERIERNQIDLARNVRQQAIICSACSA